METKNPGRYRIPVVTSREELKIPWNGLMTTIGGKSVIDSERLYLTDQKTAREFVKAYGFDLKDPEDLNIIGNIRDLAFLYLADTVLPYKGIEEIPPEFLNLPIEELLLQASDPNYNVWPNWPCILLKVIHCAAHALHTLDTDVHLAGLKKMKARYAPYLHTGDEGIWFGDDDCKIPLVAFDVKERKSFSRMMTKLLHKPGNLAFALYDHIGVRFVTYDIFSAILLLRFLRSRNLLVAANSMPERVKNSLAELEEVKDMFRGGLFEVSGTSYEEPIATDRPVENINPFSDRSFKMIKIVERILVKVGKNRRVFFPYEIQVLDKNTWDQIQSGTADHKAYETRQLNQVRKRLFAEN